MRAKTIIPCISLIFGCGAGGSDNADGAFVACEPRLDPADGDGVEWSDLGLGWGSSDDDGDGVINRLDNCPAHANPDQEAAWSGPLGVACDNLALVPIDVMRGLPENQFYTGMAASNGTLTYGGADEQVSVDAEAGTYNVTSQLDALQSVNSAQGDDLWGHCTCGNSTELERYSISGDVVDSIDSESLGIDLTVRAAAWNEDDDVLWIYSARSEDNWRGMLIAVCSDAEPDVVLDTFGVSFDVGAMTWHDGNLWVASGRTILQIHTEGRRVVASYATAADEDGAGYAEYYGIASDGRLLYVLKGQRNFAGEAELTDAQVDTRVEVFLAPQ